MRIASTDFDSHRRTSRSGRCPRPPAPLMRPPTRRDGPGPRRASPTLAVRPPCVELGGPLAPMRWCPLVRWPVEQPRVRR
eukprot:15473032-Alexandrium_andersonii.AAC.1